MSLKDKNKSPNTDLQGFFRFYDLNAYDHYSNFSPVLTSKLHSKGLNNDDYNHANMPKDNWQPHTATAVHTGPPLKTVSPLVQESQSLS